MDRASEFLATAHLYKLGLLPTEMSHPATRNMAALLRQDLPQTTRLLQMVDLHALARFQTYLPRLKPLAAAIQTTIKEGGRIFLCGCGATGRLALSLESLWRETFPADKDRVVSFMAGGDVALVHSLEGFEDFPEYGAEQLTSLGFRDGDLLISSTEGGETPFVIGATEAAAQISQRNAFFLYCNPREILDANVERSQKVFANPKITNIELFVGPMALAGSTRMQASTVLQLAIGICLFENNWVNLPNQLGQWIDHYKQLPITQISEFITAEAELYSTGGRALYESEELVITVFTDTTERSPTFSLPAFNNHKFPRPDHSLVYVMIPSAKSVDEAWRKLLKREPRVLNWPERNQKTTMGYLTGFDFSAAALAHRQKAMPDKKHARFQIAMADNEVTWSFEGKTFKFPRFGRHVLYDHLILKMLLNIHSTLVMGKMGRFESNFMTYVTPTNGKLVDRASRYVKWLLELRGGKVPSDEQVVRELFNQLEKLKEGESVVVKTADHLAISMA